MRTATRRAEARCRGVDGRATSARQTILSHARSGLLDGKAGVKIRFLRVWTDGRELKPGGGDDDWECGGQLTNGQDLAVLLRTHAAKTLTLHTGIAQHSIVTSFIHCISSCVNCFCGKLI